MAKKKFPRLIKILVGCLDGHGGRFAPARGRADARRTVRAFLGAGRTKLCAATAVPVRAAALSYTTLLALIPLLAVAISVTSSLLKSEGEEKIYRGD